MRNKTAPSCAERAGRAEDQTISADWFGLACEFHVAGELVRGYVRNLSHTGFFVETTAPLEAGHELEVRLVGGATHRPVYIRGVVEQIISPEALDPHSPPGIQFRLLRFSLAYAQLIAGDDATEHPDEPTQPLGHPTERKEDDVWLSEILGSGGRTRAPKPRPSQISEEWEEYEPLPERAGVPLWGEDSMAPEAIVIDDGELDDVVGVLAELGVKAQRQSPTGDSFLATWTPPQHLLVVTARRALELRLPLKSPGKSFVSIAVADSDARMLYSKLRRLGFQYAISRPIHPLLMSLLFRQAVFADDEKRVAPRAVLGGEVRWWCGWGRKRPGVALDVALGGCRLLVQDAVARGSRIKIRVPEGLADRRSFTLEGRVIRLTRGISGTTLGVSFDHLSDGVRESLQKLLALPGPCRLRGEPLWPEGDLAVSESVEAPRDEAPEDRRRKLRVAFPQDVVALEHDSTRVKHLLVSSDLTVDGMRVEAHPSLVLCEHLKLALYEDAEGGPLILSAVVARDDGPAGWWLRFVELSPEVQQRLTQLLGRFPPIARLTGTGPESSRVVLGQVIVQADAPVEGEPA